MSVAQHRLLVWALSCGWIESTNRRKIIWDNNPNSFEVWIKSWMLLDPHIFGNPGNIMCRQVILGCKLIRVVTLRCMWLCTGLDLYQVHVEQWTGCHPGAASSVSASFCIARHSFVMQALHKRKMHSGVATRCHYTLQCPNLVSEFCVRNWCHNQVLQSDDTILCQNHCLTLVSQAGFRVSCHRLA